MPSTITIEGFPIDVKRGEIDDLFYKYGKIKKIDKHDGNWFVTYDDYRSSHDAVHGRNCYNFDGFKLNVKHYLRKQKQKTMLFIDKTSPFTLNVTNAKCSVNIGEDGHGFINIEF